MASLDILVMAINSEIVVESTIQPCVSYLHMESYFANLAYCECFAYFEVYCMMSTTLEGIQLY